ncbi:GTP cyclohydrolase I FolE [Candidatus Peregrinibacteria bacterium]|jgi:GTP cyclohydrolase IA|nr:GTP cyclohydrolase I FolE [Candidatus Peregrinibacteria bacterium]
MQTHIKSIIELIGEDPSREGLKETPRRVEAAYKKIFSGYTQKPEDVLTVFDSEGYDEMIICKDIEFYSMCEHHMLPFFGKASIAYIPDKKIIGLSKLPRLIEIFARRLQNQERLTSQVAKNLMEMLKPKGVGVIIRAKHLCMMARGIEKQSSEMISSALHGRFKTDEKTRAEFMQLVS